MLYRGTGGNWHPHAPCLDRLIISRVVGVRGRAVGVIFASSDKEQALGYARDGSEDHLSVVLPGVGSVVRWIPGVGDMTISFEAFLRQLSLEGVRYVKGVDLRPFLSDVAGDVSIFERYLELGRQKRAASVIVDLFLGEKRPQERILTGDTDLVEELSGHQGEVWLTPPYVLEAYTPDKGLCPR